MIAQLQTQLLPTRKTPLPRKSSQFSSTSKNNIGEMSSYSACQFQEDWVYDIDQDFHAPDGTPATWAPGQPQRYGEEHAQISVQANYASANADESLIALSVGGDIQIYAIGTGNVTPSQVLKGSSVGDSSRLSTPIFHPKDPKILLFIVRNFKSEEDVDPPEILLWNLNKHGDSDLPTDASASALSRQAGFIKLVSGLFPSFNLTGTSFAFLPGELPKANCDAKWDIRVFDMNTNSVRSTLVGHRDNITWMDSALMTNTSPLYRMIRPSASGTMRRASLRIRFVPKRRI